MPVSISHVEPECHGLGIAGQIQAAFNLKSRDSWLSISVELLYVNYVNYRNNII